MELSTSSSILIFLSCVHKEKDVCMKKNTENYFALKQNYYNSFQWKNGSPVTVILQEHCCSLHTLTGHFLKALQEDPLAVLLSNDHKTTFSVSESARLILYKDRNYSTVKPALDLLRSKFAEAPRTHS